MSNFSLNPNQAEGLTLRDLPTGSQGEVAGFKKALQSYRDKLLSMGLTRGTPFTVLRVAPLGDPVEIQVRGFRLSLRKAEAEVLLVKRLDTGNCDSSSCAGCSDKGACHG